MVGRIAKRLVVREETIWARLNELREARQERRERPAAEPPAPQKAKAAPEERQLLELLLAEPALVAAAAAGVSLDEIAHPGLRRLLGGLYALQSEGTAPTLDLLRARMDGDPLLVYAQQMQEVGQHNPNRAACLAQLLAFFRQKRLRPVRQELTERLHAASDHAQALELLRQLQARTGDFGPDASSVAGVRS
jgi:DNA primase